ncbi:hypothetical protein EHS25_002563 [Saitozyma podzolica]|uniref:DUF1275 domain protein n=1 Tax=Saitozyma podzolica TaxID=1890683 RepID=A0A427YCK4_9TREE|nr:hypothetical protein EHS25_002563 [Saitozyma podzolica]
MPRLLSTGCLARLGSYGRDEIDPKALIGPLLLVTFSAGVLDITTYVNFGTFASNQTGNTFILITILTGLPAEKANLALTGSSFLAFLITAFLFARLSLVGGPRHRKRWWLLLSLATQCVLLLLPSMLVTTGVVPIHGASRLDWLLLGLLASSAGVQVVMARTSGNPEIPSAMLTSPYIDFLVDPALFKSVRGDGTRKRNVRFLYILALVGGGFVGGGVQQGGGTKAVLWLGMGLRGITMS